jgi:TonB family protein
MWKQGVDTSAVFRNLSSLSAMGIVEQEFAVSPGSITQEQFQKAVKRSIEELYRSNPTIVDSLFNEYAVPALGDADLSGAVEDGEIKSTLLEEYKQKALKAVDKHYEQPKIQEGITGLPYPDSLRTRENSGRVEIQLHINKDGAVDAVEVIEGTHPTLNAIVMQAATKTKWQPAFVTDGQEQTPHSGWGRLSTNFPAPR